MRHAIGGVATGVERSVRVDAREFERSRSIYKSKPNKIDRITVPEFKIV